MKKAFNICIAVIDVALLVVILTSAFTKKEDKVDNQSASINVTNEEYSQGQTGNFESESSDTDSYEYDYVTSNENTGEKSDGGVEDWLVGGATESENQETADQIAETQDSDYSQFGSSDSYYTTEWEGKEAPQLEMTMDDFAWYKEGILNDWIPENAVYFDDFEKLKGKWRVYINFDPKNETGEEADFLLYMDISGDPDNVTCTFDWYWEHYYFNPEGSFDESDDSHFYGTYADNVLHAEGGGKMDLKFFYSYDGSDYVLGSMEDRNGTQAIIAMVKP